MKKPRSWNEARRHPGIYAIEYDQLAADDPDFPYTVLLEDGWSFNGDLTVMYFYSLNDFQGVWQDIINEEGVD
tara:strand:+ start:60 stop:278 length:219 start_codon:yes stop_codon:yes gene_type:complete